MLGARFDAVLQRAQQGDAAAVGELWRDANPMLLRYLRVTAGQDAEDIASVTWLRAAEGFDSFSGGEPGFRRWLVTIARNTHLDDVRRASSRREQVSDDVGELLERSPAQGEDPAAQVEERMSTRRALGLIASLPPDQAELVMLRVVVGLDVGDVAAVTGRTPGSVRVAVHRALRRLRGLVEVAHAGEPGTAAPEGRTELSGGREQDRVTASRSVSFSPRDERRAADWRAAPDT
jgi:RNA polymerase sigma-70 factor (ECF subfamily)